MLVVYVVFISTVTFRVNAMYMGGVPVAEHGTWLPGSILTATFETILGGASEVIFQFC